MYESASIGEAGAQRPIDRSRHPIASGFPVALGDDATRPRSAHCGERRYGNIWRLRHGGQSRPLRSRYAAFDLTGSSHRPSGRSDSASSVRPLLPRRLLRLAPRVRAVSIRFLPRGSSAGLMRKSRKFVATHPHPSFSAKTGGAPGIRHPVKAPSVPRTLWPRLCERRRRSRSVSGLSGSCRLQASP